MPRTNEQKPRIPDVILKFKGKAENGSRDYYRDQIIENDIPDLMTIEHLIDPNDASQALKDYWFISNLEKFVVPEEDLPASLIKFVETATRHFQRAAVNEGFIQDETLKLKVKFIKADTWADLVNHYTLGGHDYLTNYSYVLINDLNHPQEILQAALTTFHEMRHRVGNIYLKYLVDSSNEEPYQIAGFNPNLSRLSVNSDFFLFEELYTVAYVAKGFELVLEETSDQILNDAWRERKEAFQQMNFPQILGAETEIRTNDQGKIDTEEMGGYYSLLKIHNALKNKIPNIDYLLNAVRRGDHLSRNTLAKSIVNTFGQDFLRELCTLNVNDLNDFADKLEPNVELPSVYITSKDAKPIKNREAVRYELTNEQFTQDLAITITNSPQDLSIESELVEFEKASIPAELIPEEIKKFLSIASEHFWQVAVNEGMVTSRSNLEFRIRFVNEKKWDEIYDTNTAGVYATVSNCIYVKLTESPSPQQLLSTLVYVFHEMRHRVGNRSLFYEYDKATKDSILKIIKSNLHFFTSHPDNFKLFEEMFTIAFVAENFENILREMNNEELIEAWEERVDANANGLAINIKGVETLMITKNDGALDPNETTQYIFPLIINSMLSANIPDLSDLYIAVRRGDKHSRNKLARAIIDNFDKTTLLKLMKIKTLDDTYKFLNNLKISQRTA